MAFQVTIDQNKCKGCELCVAFCKPGTLHMSHGFNAAGLHFADCRAAQPCLGCKQCVIICPEAAIELERNDQE